ncbi:MULTISPECIES: ABC transporter substrate-binding protein [Deinococcus]|uniref:ABC-type Fe3+-siderophore transport system, periplasmic component n=1 Tax=Deinococcus geothermalis (strain DSM 11300 / CIP 105573 / AG-3a) TaxID=319795 RepID=Q1J2U7_DEIGD|nr:MULTISPECIES: iron-siderophore ABC transporter substrate-binding protein [Deinococcus]ABF44187.1 ABC-type Fe3+-siderophore transport system, periplasmic component [Deinococcus geothermalis DSM 11300]MBI0446802.1 iron-siderophore ABC transporter substrate-binding protein [Deinococcus sp. DB0503]
MKRPLKHLLAIAAFAGAGLAGAQACSGQLVQHALGHTCVPKQVKRVVALEWTYAEDLLALGVQPVGVADLRGYGEWVNIPIKLGAGVQDVGTRQQPNLERIRALKPDLILTAKLRATQNYAQLQAIAPTIVFDPFAGGSQVAEMRRTFQTIGGLVGRPKTARQVLSTLDLRLSRVAQDLKKAGRAGETFVFAQAFTARGGAPTMRLFTSNSMVSELLTQVGLVNAWNARPDPYGFTEVSLEPLSALKTQNFLYVTPADDNVFAAPSVQPLWQGLSFVKAGRAYPLNEKTWTFGGPLSAITLMNELSRRMLRP